ncbi:metallophosphoesterase [bacterium]|nr:metallophosphoesterase [bacterium]
MLMCYRITGKKAIVTVSVLLFLFLLAFYHKSQASDPHSALYSPDNNKIFWFIIISDVHIGAKGYSGSENLEWIVTEAKGFINPSFIVNAGDMTDSTNWSDLGYPDGPHVEEWQAYRNILSGRVDSTFYYDIPGNHDHYRDKNFDYYLNYSIQGTATGQTQISWTRTFDFGKYHFLGINTAGNDGAEFSMLPPDYGDNAGLDTAELTFIANQLENNKDADITMIFGHHAIVTRDTDWADWSFNEAEEWTETALFYGANEFISLMEDYNVLMYGYGHSHIYREEFFTKNMSEGVIYLNVASLSKSEGKNYNIVAIDNNGISTVSPDIGVWPAVIITAPLDRNLGTRQNPYTSNVTDLSGDSTPIRALVFDKQTVTQVEYMMYKIQENAGEFIYTTIGEVIGMAECDGVWTPMTQVDPNHSNYPYLWEADCNVPSAEGEYTIVVRAKGSTVQMDTIPTAFPIRPVNEAGCFIETAAFGNADEDKY